jgi:hypothetical protein
MVEVDSCARMGEALSALAKIRANKNRMSWNFDMIGAVGVQM